MDLFMMLLTTALIPIFHIYPSRIISQTFNTSAKSITIKNKKLAKMLIAKKNTWGIETDFDQKNKMSLWGIISYLIFLPQIAFIPYNWWIYMKTGSGEWCGAEQSYLWTAMLYYAIVLSIKLKEAIKFSKGEI
ncbi:MAG: hypothetical protein HDQ98_16310 [Lachnospiraceae bacterium]|nr:hypothetical protein [Lachnospiraceae bacterium]